jgi:hypothetical protein
MDRDALNLFDEDRQRFLTLYRDFLANPDVPPEIKTEYVTATENAVRGIGMLRPTYGK